ncbi:glycosyltransferase [Aeromonas enteropelogenes]|uniref:glycosyltransferase n=1 Tax=Aeromonas enteropelogenes TaxID=29489 RepID=UPI003B9DFE95
MKILIYNWADCFNNSSRGGGVTIYLKRLIAELKKNHDIVFVSSGESYNPFKSHPHLNRLKGEGGVEVYEIVNSEVMAPANLEYGSDAVLAGGKTLAVWKKLLEVIKPDVVHFNNIEGLPLDAFKVKEVLPSCIVLYSIHNYYGFCANVKLWKENQKSCPDWNNKKDCYQCCYGKTNIFIEYKVKMIKWLFRQIGIEAPKWIYKYLLSSDSAFKLGRPMLDVLLSSRSGEKDSLYDEIKEKFVYCLNNYCDSILPVSKRVSYIAQSHGVLNDKIITCYIGTDLPVHSPLKRIGNKLSILYMGYMSKEKGFDFLIKALNKLEPIELLGIELTIAAKNTNEVFFREMQLLSKRVSSFRYYDGYSKEIQKEIMAECDVSIVPILWEDNLPQVAIESVMYGVPILVSDLGGAKELCNSDPRFTFKHGDVEDFLSKIRFFINNKNNLNTFWCVNKKIPSMVEHVDELSILYRGLEHVNSVHFLR